MGPTLQTDVAGQAPGSPPGRPVSLPPDRTTQPLSPPPACAETTVSEEPPRAARTAPGKGSYRLERWLIRNLLCRLGRLPVAVVLPDGQELTVADQTPEIRVRFHDRRAIWLLALDPELYFGDCYMEGRLDVEGDLGRLLQMVFQRLALEDKRPAGLATRLLRLLRRSASNTLERSRRNVAHHYDIGDAFYELWLDKKLLYTCAYFPHPDADLEQAQQAKMEHVCRKVWLRPGETVVEAGCGWGALALYMARHYGVRVHAYNISRNQIAYARRRAKAEGLDDRVQFIEDDYRNIRGEFDVFVSIGMLEHVGPAHYTTLAKVIDRSLKPDGRGILHSIGRDRPMEGDRWISRRIFPGAYAPSLQEMLDVLEPHGFSVLDVENLRLHYALTLQHWLDRFEKARDQVAQMFDERFVRMWRLYLTGARTAFITGTLQLFQIVFSRTGQNAIPWTRAGVYGQPVPPNPYARSDASSQHQGTQTSSLDCIPPERCPHSVVCNPILSPHNG